MRRMNRTHRPSCTVAHAPLQPGAPQSVPFLDTAAVPVAAAPVPCLPRTPAPVPAQLLHVMPPTCMRITLISSLPSTARLQGGGTQLLKQRNQQPAVCSTASLSPCSCIAWQQHGEPTKEAMQNGLQRSTATSCYHTPEASNPASSTAATSCSGVHSASPYCTSACSTSGSSAGKQSGLIHHRHILLSVAQQWVAQSSSLPKQRLANWARSSWRHCCLLWLFATATRSKPLSTHLLQCEGHGGSHHSAHPPQGALHGCGQKGSIAGAIALHERSQDKCSDSNLLQRLRQQARAAWETQKSVQRPESEHHVGFSWSPVAQEEQAMPPIASLTTSVLAASQGAHDPRKSSINQEERHTPPRPIARMGGWRHSDRMGALVQRTHSSIDTCMRGR